MIKKNKIKMSRQDSEQWNKDHAQGPTLLVKWLPLGWKPSLSGLWSLGLSHDSAFLYLVYSFYEH